MLAWEETQREADRLRSEIEAAVLELGKSQTVGNVRASYSAGRKSYDYDKAIQIALESGAVGTAELKTFEYSELDARGACKGLGIEAVPYTQSEPSVSVKLVA